MYVCMSVFFTYISQTKTARQGRGSYLFSIVFPLCSRIAGCQVPRHRCLSLAAYSLGAYPQLLIACIPGLLVARCLSLGA